MLQRLPESLHTLYAELLDQSIRAEVGLAPGVPRQGSFVSKIVKGRRYWYLQRLEGDRKRQHYLGPDSDALLAWMREIEEQRRSGEPDTARRAQLVEMLVAGGAARENGPVTRVLAVLADCGMFRLGAVVVGTQAFTCYANMLGVRFEQGSARTQDVDIAQERSLAVALAPDMAPVDAVAAMQRAEPALLPAPALDSRKASTFFKVRGRDLRVDFLTPADGSSTEKPVWLPLFGVAATPLPLLAYLVEGSVQAAVLGGSGVLINVPSPGRFALHKLAIARQRPVSEQAKSRKDVRQASQVLEVLLQDRPEEIRSTWEGLRRRSDQSAIRKGLVAQREIDAIARTLELLDLRART